MRALFQAMHDPPEITGINLKGMTPREIQALLPEYNDTASNPMYGIFVDDSTGRAFGFQSGQTFGEAVHGQLTFRRGTLSSVEIERTNINFITQEAHIEAQVSGFMWKHAIAAGTLYINGSGPCLGPFGCNENLPYLLPPGARLKVYGLEMEGLYQGRPAQGDAHE